MKTKKKLNKIPTFYLKTECVVCMCVCVKIKNAILKRKYKWVVYL